MPATPTRAAFIREEFRLAVALTPDAGSRFGTLAQESANPVETFFDDVDDALEMAEERQELLGTERRRFEVLVDDIEAVKALDYTGNAIIGTYVDSERGINKTVLVSEIVMDFDNGNARLTVWG